MNAKELAAKMRGLAASIGDQRVMYVATGETLKGMADRVWRDGILSDGGRISYKEDYEVWIHKPPFPRVGNKKGKPRKNGKAGKVKGGWAPTYLAAKEQVGRGDMPFELTGDLRKAWLGGIKPVGGLEVVIDLVNRKELEKVQGLTEQKGAFLLLTADERKAHLENIITAYNELVLKKW